MPVLNSFHPTVSVETILRWQGADPSIIQKRRPQLIHIAEKALEAGLPLLRPQVLMEEFPIVEIRHRTVLLGGRQSLAGSGLVGSLAGADTLIAVIATIGSVLETEMDRQMEMDPPAGLALEGLANAALDDLMAQICHQVDSQPNRFVTTPLSPGMDGWSTEEGQAQLFSLLPAADIGVRLTEHGWMLPRKSSSFVLGVGSQPFTQTGPCQVCGLRETCRYRKDKSHA